LFISLFFNPILVTKLFIPTEKGKGGKAVKNSCENYPFFLFEVPGQGQLAVMLSRNAVLLMWSPLQSFKDGRSQYFRKPGGSNREFFQQQASNTNAISSLSLRAAERGSSPVKNEIAAPFGLAMTTWGVKIFNAFVLVNDASFFLFRLKFTVRNLIFIA
jgi:hypothetical protein